MIDINKVGFRTMMFAYYTLFISFIFFVGVTVYSNEERLQSEVYHHNLPKIGVKLLPLAYDGQFMISGAYYSNKNEIQLSIYSTDVERSFFHEMGHYWYKNCLTDDDRDDWMKYCDEAIFEEKIFEYYSEDNYCEEKFAMTTVNIFSDYRNTSIMDYDIYDIFVYDRLIKCVI